MKKEREREMNKNDPRRLKRVIDNIIPKTRSMKKRILSFVSFLVLFLTTIESWTVCGTLSLVFRSDLNWFNFFLIVIPKQIISCLSHSRLYIKSIYCYWFFIIKRNDLKQSYVSRNIHRNVFSIYFLLQNKRQA